MTKIAKLYGGSLYDLASAENLEELLLEEIKVVRKLFSANPDYVKLLQEPSIPAEKRVELIDDAFKSELHPYLINFIKILWEKNMLREIGDCFEEYEQCFNKSHHISIAMVTSAKELTEEQRESLLKRLSEITKETIILKCRVDKSLIGGLVVNIDGKELDGSVKTRLKNMSNQINKVIV